MIALFDVNVLVALAWPNHVHHTAALRWFQAQQAEQWATCPATQAGFVRVSANRAANPHAKPVQACIDLLRRVIALPNHVFLKDDIAIASSPHVWYPALVGYRQVADAHLLAVARRHDACFVTLDRGIRNLVPEDQRSTSVVLILSKEETREM